MHWSVKEKRYIAVRAGKGGGTETMEVLIATAYDDVVTKMKNAFFPNGKSSHGRLSNMICEVGDHRGKVVKKEEITKEKRLNLLTKNKVS